MSCTPLPAAPVVLPYPAPVLLPLLVLLSLLADLPEPRPAMPRRGGGPGLPLAVPRVRLHMPARPPLETRQAVPHAATGGAGGQQQRQHGQQSHQDPGENAGLCYTGGLFHVEY